MSAKDNLNNYQFRYRPTGPQTEYPGYFNVSDGEEGHTLFDHSVQAVHKPSGEVVGEMLWQDGGPLFMIDVDENHQRKGVATGMVQHGQKIAKASKYRIPKPSRAYSETDEGAMFADEMERKGIF